MSRGRVRQTGLMGWCMTAPGTKRGTHHGACRREYTTANGVERVCSCRKHEDENAECGE